MDFNQHNSDGTSNNHNNLFNGDTAHMAFNGGFHPQQWAQGYQYGGHMPNFSLNPAQPAFHPTGMELQRQPRSGINPDIKDMQRWIAESTSSTLSSMARVERKADKNTEKIQKLEGIVGQDLQYLESKLHALQAMVEARKTQSPAHAFETVKAIEQREESLSKFDKKEIAMAYLDQAAEKDAAAIELRKLAERLLGHSLEAAPLGPKLLEAPPGPGDKVIGFACCGTAYGAIHEMLDHIDVAHLQTMANTTSSLTPRPALNITAPASVSSQPRSRAVPIKAPETAREGPATLDLKRVQISPGTAERQAVVESSAPVQSETSTATSAAETSWTPVAVRHMKPFEGNVPPTHTESFSAELLQELFKGKDFCDGFYFMRNEMDLGGMKSYWILEDDFQPFLPKAPGEHGAKLTPLMNDAPVADARDAPEGEHVLHVPVFIRAKDGSGYRYFGHYSQTRYSDKVGYDTLKDASLIPDSIRRHWASTLSESGRPEWVTHMLIEHFFPRPEYFGPIPTDSAVNTPVTGATPSDISIEPLERRVKDKLAEYAYELKEWQKSSRINVSLLTEQEIYEAFSKADTDLVRGLRPYWEYFECVDYDAGFYDFLLHFKNNPKLAVVPSKPKKETKEEREKRLAQAAIDAAKPTQFVKHNFFNPAPVKKNVWPEGKVPPHKLAAQKAKSVEKKIEEKSSETPDSAAVEDGWGAKEEKKTEAPAAVESSGWGASESPAPATDAWGARDAASSANHIWGANTKEADDPAASNDSWGAALSSASKKIADTKTQEAEKLNGWAGFGDMEAAKAMNSTFKKAVAAPKRGRGNAVPPHLRR